METISSKSLGLNFTWGLHHGLGVRSGHSKIFINIFMSIYYVADTVLSTSHIAVKKNADKSFSVHMESTFCGQNWEHQQTNKTMSQTMICTMGNNWKEREEGSGMGNVVAILSWVGKPSLIKGCLSKTWRRCESQSCGSMKGEYRRQGVQLV